LAMVCLVVLYTFIVGASLPKRVVLVLIPLGPALGAWLALPRWLRSDVISLSKRERVLLAILDAVGICDVVPSARELVGLPE
jgi:hypothetical protein